MFGYCCVQTPKIVYPLSFWLQGVFAFTLVVLLNLKFPHASICIVVEQQQINNKRVIYICINLQTDFHITTYIILFQKQRVNSTMARPTKNKPAKPAAPGSKKNSHIQSTAIIRKIPKHALRILGRPRRPTDHKQKRRQNFTALYRLTSQDECECPICLEIFIAPVLLSCGHIFCLYCFQESVIQKPQCSLCRNTQLNDPQRYLGLQTLIRGYVLPNSSEGLSYWSRQASFNYCESKRKVTISEWLEGATIDFKDSDNVWKEGMVSDITTNENNESFLRIYILDGSQYKSIELPTNEERRLATAGYYTRRKYLEYRKQSEEIKIISNIEIPQIQGRIQNQRREEQAEGPIFNPIEDEGEPDSLQSLPLSVFHEVKEDDDEMMQLFDHQMRNVEDFLCL